MTSQTFRHHVCTVVLFLIAATNINAQGPDMNALIQQSLSKLQQPTPEAYITCIAEMKRIDAMYPDSVQPKYQLALQSLTFGIMNPHAPETQRILAEAQQTIEKLSEMPSADPSDIHTLRGFYLMTLIVQDPMTNGQRYYLEVMDNYETALKLNPNNELARQLQEKFLEGMRSYQ